MQIQQWEDANLSQFSYAILSDCEKKIILIDPVRNPQQYLEYARENNATITGVIETHPHADFVSGHLELSTSTGATIFTSSLTQAHYQHTSVGHGDVIQLGKITLEVLHTPGHSPDSISILLLHEGVAKAVFTGDTLFIGDCGRPDLREEQGAEGKQRVALARQMYHTLRSRFLSLDDGVVVYPAHGAGSLCGKGISKAASSSIGEERAGNWALQEMPEEEFVHVLLSDLTFVPAYFPFDVALNLQGAPPFRNSVESIKIGNVIHGSLNAGSLQNELLVVDARDGKKFKLGHLRNSVNLMEDGKFETWLGSIVKPGEPFYLAGENKEQLQHLVERAAGIGYESQIRKAFVLEDGPWTTPLLNIEDFKANPGNYTIVDVRNNAEVNEHEVFESSLSIPLHELRERVQEIPVDKPVVVHCAGGYRSAAGSSIIQNHVKGKLEIFDLGDAVKAFGAFE